MRIDYKKRYELDRKNLKCNIKRIENTIRELDNNYMIEMESLLIDLEYAKSNLDLLESSSIEEYYDIGD